MSKEQEIHTLLNQMYTVELVLRSFRGQPKTYCGVTLYDNESHTLEAIAENPGISQAQLSQRMCRTKGATSVMVDKLMEKGLILRQRESEDRRRCVLTLTALGRQVNQAHVAFDSAHAAKVSAALELDEEDFRRANQVIAQLIDFHREYSK